MSTLSSGEVYYVTDTRGIEYAAGQRKAVLVSEGGMQVHVPLLSLVALSPLVRLSAEGLCTCHDVHISLPGFTHAVLLLLAEFAAGRTVDATLDVLVAVAELCRVLVIDVDIIQGSRARMYRCDKETVATERVSGFCWETNHQRNTEAAASDMTKACENEIQCNNDSNIKTEEGETCLTVYFPEANSGDVEDEAMMEDEESSEIMQMTRFVKSRKDRPKKMDQGFLYVFDRASTNGAIHFWRCERKNTCKGRIHTDATTQEVLKRMNGHTHNCGIVARKTRKDKKDRSKDISALSGHV